MTQMNMGELIAALEKVPATEKLTLNGAGLGDIGSYRGYYDEVALEPDGKVGTVGEALQRLRLALGSTMTGYKGGDYVIQSSTPVWVSHYGECSGQYVTGVAILADGIGLATEQAHW